MYLENHRIRLSIRKVFFLLLFIVLILVVMHFFPGSLSRMIQNRFNLDGEANIPTWYSTVLLFFVSLTSLGIYILSDNVSHLHLRGFWLVFSGVYCFLSLDEAACLHEIIDIMTSIKWVYVYAPFAGIFFLICAYYLIKNDNRIVRQWIVGGLLIYALGALICELVSHLLYPLPPLLQQVEFALEESFELIGTIMVLMGCLQELSRCYEIFCNAKKN